MCCSLDQSLNLEQNIPFYAAKMSEIMKVGIVEVII